MKRKTILLAFILGLMSGCAPGTAAAPTPFPPDYLPTVVALTGQAAFATSSALTPTLAPTASLPPTETAIPPTALPTLTPTPEPGFTEFARIHFISPGPMSRIISPLQLQMLIVSGDSGIVKFDLLGEDGRVLYTKLERISNETGDVYINYKIPFEIRAVSELGWLQVSSKDARGRMEILNTLQVLLLSTGVNEINIPGNIIYERCMLEMPKRDETVSGGVVTVKGRMWPFNDQPVFASLILEDGTTAGARVLAFNGLEPQLFETTIPYKIGGPTGALLTFRQDDPTLNIPVYVFTQEIQLNP